MTFVTYLDPEGPRLGVSDRPGGAIVDVARAAAALGGDVAPTTMLGLIALGDEAAALAGRLLSAADLPASARVSNGVRLLAAIPRPCKNIIAVGLNYAAHSHEFTGTKTLTTSPIIFTKSPTAVVGPGDTICLRPDLSTSIDYEGELGVIIGKAGSDIAPEAAEEHVFGYVIINDVTARDLQKRTSQWFLGKSLDTFCPMGPYLVHRSSIGWPVELDLRTTVNGELRQESNTRQFIFDIPALLAAASSGITLEPGDIIATGTPQGVGMAYDPPRFLKRGDVVEVTIDGLGTLRNPVA